ncbi:MFS transporter [Streptomyces odontomachi]|uniref:MFS transporter n=1 Tax=Streptomyces odontomachi TaxID=2944940 RepID=UPI0021091113|nr:MFS transporter [Streptomyces sp. ODS25]
MTPAWNVSRRRPIAAMSLTHAVDDLYQGVVPALIPFLVAERHYTYAAASGITLAATVLSSITQPLFGVLIDRRRMTWLVPVGVTLAGTGIGLAGLSGSYVWTWLAIALSGLGVAAYHPEASRAARVAAGGSAQGMSWFALGGNVGFALGPLFATPVLAHAGVSGTPLLAIPALLTGAALVVRRRAGAAARTPAKSTTTTPAPDDDWRAFAYLTGVVTCRSICFFGVSSFLALYFTRNLGATASAGNTALTVLFVAGAAGTLLGGRLADRWGRVPVVRLGHALVVPGLAGLLLAPNAGAGYVAAAVLGLAVYVPFSVQVTLGQEYLPNRVGTASGVTLGLAVSVGGTVAPALGVLADHLGLRAVLVVLFVCPAVALLLSARLPGRGARGPLRSPAVAGAAPPAEGRSDRPGRR